MHGGTTAKIKHLKHCHNIGEPRFLPWREFTGDMIDQEFFKRGPSQGSGTKQNEVNSETKCEISVSVHFLTFSVQNLGYNEHRSRGCIVFLCRHTIKNIQWRLNPFNSLWVHQCSDTWRKRNSVLNLTSREPVDYY